MKAYDTMQLTAELKSGDNVYGTETKYSTMYFSKFCKVAL